MNYPVWPESGSSSGPPAFSRSSNVRPPPDDPAGKSPSKFNGQHSSSVRSNNEDHRIQQQQSESSKYATLTATPAFSEEENLLKVAAHFLSSGQSGRHYVRDYSSTMGYPNPTGTVAVSTPSSSASYNCHPAGHQSRNSAEAAGRTGLMESSSSGGGMANGTANHPLLSPCGAMEEASSPGSAASSQISYLGALQNPASLTQLGFPNHYLLSKDGAGLAAAAAAAHHAAQQHHQVMNNSSSNSGSKKKEPKPGSDVRSFICQVCGRGFKQKATLAQHERTHTDERPFDCPDCHKRFRQQSHLVQHIRIHSDERPYACTYCDKAFRQKAILNQHIRIHTGEKPYVCPQCTKCFRQKAILNQHIRTHSGKRPYSCPDSKCKKKFVDQVSMEKHFKKHIEDDQNQLLAEARGLIGANSGGGGGSGGAGGGGAITSPSSAADRINHNAKGLLRVKLDRPPSTFNRLSQDRATSPFPINMMMIRGQQQPNSNNSPGRSNELPTQQEVNSYHHHQAVAAAAAAASGPYQFVPFPHRPYHYDLLGLGSMGQSIYGGNNKMMEQAASTKYRESLDVNNQMSNQVVEPNNVAGNNTYSTPVNSTANSKSDGGP